MRTRTSIKKRDHEKISEKEQERIRKPAATNVKIEFLKTILNGSMKKNKNNKEGCEKVLFQRPGH